MDDARKWFQQALGARADAFEAQLATLREGDEEGEAAIRHLARVILTPSGSYGFPMIYTAAKTVVDSAPDSLKKATEALVRTLRTESARAKRWAQTILIIGGDEAFNGDLLRELSTANREVLRAHTAAEALHILSERVVVSIVLNLFLPDQDGRAILARLQENPLTASIPVMILGRRVEDSVKEDSLFSQIEEVMENPTDPGEVAKWVNSRLRRARESLPEARRDPLTGLLNRASLREACERSVEQCKASREPAAFCLLAVNQVRQIINTYGAQAAEEVVRRVAGVLSRTLRASDTLGRWGVSEFGILFPGEDQFGASQAIRKAMESLKQESFTAPDGEPLALTLSAGVVVLSGESTVESAMDGADRFLFYAQSAEENAVVSSATDLPKPVEQILLILKDATIARVLKRLFQQEGFEVTHLSDAAAAIEAASGDRTFHLILTDEKISDQGGMDVLQEIRRLPRHTRAAVVMLVSPGSVDVAVRALELGANDYVMTPIAPIPFMARMRRLLSRGTVLDTRAGRILRVLVVDADRRVLLLAASALHQHGGFEVFLAADAQDASHRIPEVSPDLLLLVADLPEGQSAALLQRVRERVEAEETDVILLVEPGKPLPFDRSTVPRIAGQIQKPFNARELGGEILKILSLPPSLVPRHAAGDHLNREIQRIAQAGRAQA